MTPTTACPTVYFDGGCPVCTREIDIYRRMQPADGGVAFVDVSRLGAAPAPDLTREAALARFHLRDANGQLVSGARAFIALWQATPKLRLIGRIAALPPIPLILEGGYRAFLVLRRLWRKPSQA